MKNCATRFNIMDATVELIWSSSFESVSVSDICKKAKINKGSFYHFFESKEVLAAEAMKYYSNQTLPIIEEVFSQKKKPIKRLMDYCDAVLEIQIEKKEKSGFVCGCPYTNLGLEQSAESAIIHESVQKCLDRSHKHFVSSIKEAIKLGDIPKFDVNQKADELFTFYIGSLARAKIKNDLKPLYELKRVFKEVLKVAEE